jgi:REP element-mobilizing transposase RayT
MAALEPLYTADNCKAAYQLNWSLSIFWKVAAPPEDQWRQPLSQACELDGVRILEHRFTQANVSQFLLSTQPQVSPSDAIRSVKGRLQYLMRAERPKAFRRNYSIHSVGSANDEAVDRYVAAQLEHHRMADARVQQRLARKQHVDPSIDLSAVRSSSYGQFMHNLHIVFVHQDRGVDVREGTLDNTLQMIQGVACKKGHLLSRATVLADHVHFTIGCDVAESPQDVALAYLNNLAFTRGMQPVFQFGFYVGTFGPYDLNAVRRALGQFARMEVSGRSKSPSRRDEPGGEE